MDDFFAGKARWSFGPNQLRPHRDPPPLVYVSARRRSELRARVREHCLRRPGVYGMLDAKRQLVYVGKAKCLRSRLLSYFRTKSRDPKAGRILDHTRFLVWEYAPNEFAALLRELELIRRWRPRFNVQGQPGRRRPAYVCLGRAPAPYAFLARELSAGVLAAFGPIPASRHARDAVRYLNDEFRLRDCSQRQTMVFADQAELFPIVRAAGCLRYEIRTCLGPCLGACSRAEYIERVRAAERFLGGCAPELLTTLEAAMTGAAAALMFERAAALRDKWEGLRWLQQRLDRLRVARERPGFIYPVPSQDGREVWYLIQGGRVVAALPRPRGRKQRQAAAKRIAAFLEAKSAPATVVPASEMDAILLVAAWFRRHPEEEARILQPRQVLEFLREQTLRRPLGA